MLRSTKQIETNCLDGSRHYLPQKPLQKSKRYSIGWFIAGLSAFLLVGVPAAVAKKFGKLSCYKKICWRVPSRENLTAHVGHQFIAHTSWYDIAARDRYNKPGLTSSGEKFDPKSLDRISSPNLPNGTKVLLWSAATKVAAYVIVNNTGPFMSNRVIDVPIGLAREMGFAARGVTKLYAVIVEPPSPEDVRYSSNRRYDFEGGLLGRFNSLSEAVDVLPAPIAAVNTGSSIPKPLSFGHLIRQASYAAPKHRRVTRQKAKLTTNGHTTRWKTTILNGS